MKNAKYNQYVNFAKLWGYVVSGLWFCGSANDKFMAGRKVLAADLAVFSFLSNDLFACYELFHWSSIHKHPINAKYEN